MFQRAFWKATVERAIKTAAQAALLAIGAAEGFDVFDLDWSRLVGFAGGGALLSVLTSIATSAVGGTPSPSLVPEAEAELAQ